MRLLFDEHFSEQDAAQVRLHDPSIDILSLHAWESGASLAHDDAAILAEAYLQGRTLVTRDVRTIPPLLVLLAQAGTSHGGVIFVDQRAIPEGNTGALVRSLLALWQEESETDWTDRVAYLRPRNPSGETRAGEGHHET